MNSASAPDLPAGDLPTGRATMSPAMEGMRHYQRYLYLLLAPRLGGRVLEIGVGHGILTRWLAERADVLATDIDDECLERANRLFAEASNVSTARLDLTDAASVAACGGFEPDTIVCVNVLEHIERDAESLKALREIVTPGGRLLIVVPAHAALYGRMDREAGHFRRYTRRSLAAALAEACWRVDQIRYVNAVGAAGWWINNRLRKSAGLEDAAVNMQMRLADRCLPAIAKLTDPVLGRAFGLSVFAAATKV